MNAESAIPKMPKQEVPPIPPMPQFTPSEMWKNVQNSPHFNFVLICFAALFLTTIVAALMVIWMRKSGEPSPEAKEIARNYDTIIKYIDQLEIVRVEQDQFMKRQLREGRWSDATKAKWDDEMKDLQRDFDLQRQELMPVLGARTQAVLRNRNSVFGAFVSQITASTVEELDDDVKDSKPSKNAGGKVKGE